jgi:hypothetical protein
VPEVRSRAQNEKAGPRKHEKMKARKMTNAKVDEFVKSQSPPFRSWFDTSPRTENQALTDAVKRSP